MRRCFLIYILLLAGCAGVEGPRTHLDNPVQVDDPHLTLEEQNRRERDRLALPDASTNVGPPTSFTPPGAPSPLEERGH